MVKSVYIHIPFCTSICTYCDFPKLLKNDKWIDAYLDALKIEIKEKYKGEIIETLYIGGGTPSALKLEELKKLFEILKIFKLSKNAEISFESNVEDLTKEKLEFLKDKINRLSIGVQTLDEELLNLLGRKKVSLDNIIMAHKYFDNINIDLMYGFHKNNIENDLKEILKLNIPHISAYSLILEEHTKLYIDNYEPNNDEDTMENYIDKVLKENGYIHYEISNYAKEGFMCKHNLTYWNNDNYYGFGLGASGYLNNMRYENTRNLTKYLNSEYTYEEHSLDLNETLQNEFILGLRKVKGINKEHFKEKYNMDIKEISILSRLLDEGLLKEDKHNIFINPKYLYLSNEILINFMDLLV